MIETIIIFLGVLILMGATIIALIATVSGQLQRLLANSINPADAASIQSGVQALSDTLTQAGAPPQ